MPGINTTAGFSAKMFASGTGLRVPVEDAMKVRDTSLLWVGKHTAAGVTVESVAPQRLNWERASAESGVRRRALARRDPRALVTVFRALRVQPPRAWELVSDCFGELVTADDRDARFGAEPVEVGTAASARVSNVGQIRVSDVAIGRAGRAVPGAVLCSKADRVVPCCRGDHVLDAGITAGGRVDEVCRGVHGLGGKLRLRWTRWSRTCVVIPNAG